MANIEAENHTRGTVIAVFFSVAVFISAIFLKLYTSLDNLNILLSVNRALALSAIILICTFVIVETLSRFLPWAKVIVPASRTLMAFGVIFALLHILAVTTILTGTYSGAWMNEHTTSVGLARASILTLILLLISFIRPISKRLGAQKWVYRQALGYMGILFVLMHSLFLSNPSASSIQESSLEFIKSPEALYLFIFLLTIVSIRIFLYFFNKKVSLQVKTVAHTLLYLTVGAIVIIFYINSSERNRNYEEIFHKNRQTIDLISSLDYENKNEKYEIADTITETSNQEISVFFLGSDKRIIHHLNKGEEDKLYTGAIESGNNQSQTLWNIKREEGRKLFLDTVIRLDPGDFLVVSADYSRAGGEINRQILSSAILIAIVTFVTAIMAIIFNKNNIINPIKRVTEAAKNISGGNFDSEIKMQSNDEFKTLADTFNNMAKTLKTQINDLMKLDKLKNEFIAIASHNLRTPLTTLRGYLDTLEMGQSGKLNKKQKETLKKAQGSTTSLVSLTEGLINITSLERGGVKIEKESVDMRQVIEDILKDMSPQIKAKGLTVENKLGAQSIKTIGDESKLKQAFMGVLDNAIKFNKEKGKITIEKIIDDTRQPTIGRREFIIKIKDTGIGISKEEKENVFQKFNRGTSTYTYEYEGVGLGLYLSRLLIQAHHGRIWFESEEGKGTTFYISLTVE